ncbi:hypothetical protein [Leisingera sp. ANG-DT]|uniref:hypothetical protein n=1 Tax=Leisingera sp. ANG-DT TaxID=1577897 RepID=UPI000583F1A3|nr:hypothetical protein [Leisingera sp. ANG-DT]KIC13926.1 hypothetical protein RA21_20985 [Leisingera sp. ANG-DT]
MRITVAIEELSGNELPPCGEAFWLADLPAHRAFAKSLWKRNAAVPNSALFAIKPHEALSDRLLDQFEQVELHFSEWSEVMFVRTELARELPAYFAARGFATEIVKNGFVVRRSVSRA